MGAILLFLNFLIYINKRKLEKLISIHKNYDDILAQSQKLDKLIIKKTNIIMNKRNS